MPILKMSSSKKSVRGAITYILNKAKSTARAVLNMNPNEDFAKQMQRSIKIWNKDHPGSRKFYHLKLAFHPGDSDRNGGSLTDKLALQIAMRITNEFFGGYQAVLSVHNDTAHKHVHMIISAVHPMTGKNVNISPGKYQQMKDRASEISAEYGLSTIDWRAAVKKKRREEIQSDLPVKSGFAERGMTQQGKESWKDELRNAIDDALIGCASMAEFRKKLANKQVTLPRCTDKKIIYQFKNYPPVRGDTLGGDYTIASVENTIWYYRNWPDSMDINLDDVKLYKQWGRLGGIPRSEVEAVVDEVQHATWQQKQDVWTIYRESKETFWTEMNRRKALLKEEMDEAYRHRRLVKDAQWVLDPRNRKSSLGGIIFAAIILHYYGNREQIEQEIQSLREKMELLRKETLEFRNQSEAALQNLRQRELTLEQYLREVRRMQELAEGMFWQPTQEMGLLWAIERKARVKEPTLEEYIEMCMREQKEIEQEEKQHEKELLV